MRRVELKDQSEIIKSIKLQGGHARKWASGWQMGMPDIVGSFVATGPFLMEVKQTKDRIYAGVPLPKELKPTDKQRMEMELFMKAGFMACLGIVVHENRIKLLFIEPPDAEFLGSITYGGPIITNWTKGQYDVFSAMCRYRRYYNG